MASGYPSCHPWHLTGPRDTPGIGVSQSLNLLAETSNFVTFVTWNVVSSRTVSILKL